MAQVDRRAFVAGSVAALAGIGVTGRAAEKSPGAGASDTGARRGNPIAVSTYSFWRFKDNLKLPIETCIDEAARMGFDGVDILLMQMENEDNAYLQKLKRRALINGLDLCCMSTHQGFVSPDAAKRQENIDKTIKQIETAYRLGIPIIRINTGRWGTTKSFDDLMANRGIEPVLPGYTEEDGFKWVIDSIGKCLPKAEECGVILGLENHWGLARTPEGPAANRQHHRLALAAGPARHRQLPRRPLPASSNSAPHRRSSSRPRPTTAAASGTPSTSTTAASPRS